MKSVDRKKDRPWNRACPPPSSPLPMGDWVVIDVVTGKRPVHNFGQVIIQNGAGSNGNFTGNVTSNVTCNVTCNVTGNVTSSVTSKVTGNITDQMAVNVSMITLWG